MKRIYIFTLFVLLISFYQSYAIVKGNFSVSITTGSYFYVDHNNCSGGGGPRAGYLGVKISNTSGASQNNIELEFVKYTDSVRYSLAGGQSNTQSLPVLANAASDTFFFYSTYPCFFNGIGFPTKVIFKVKDLDDGTSYLDTLSRVLTTEEQISSNGGGLVGTSRIIRRDPVGGLFVFQCDYDYPKLVAGDIAYLQPTVNLSFDAASYQLESAVILNSSANSPGCIPIGNCPLNYIVSGTCNAFSITVEYSFRINSDQTTTAYPYNSATSGMVGTKYVITPIPVYLNPAVVLPIELTDYTAKVENNEVVNSWTTASEYNNAFFNIEKSRDAVSFEEIGKVNGAGNSNSISNYSFTDTDPYSGISYYRLGQTDFDGRVTYSNIVVVNFLQEKIPNLRLYPNPSDGLINLAFDNYTDDDVNIKICDVTGKVIKDTDIRIMGNNNTIQLSLIGIVKGEYFIYYTCKSNTGIRKVVVR